jgi:hypothetical protein
MQHLPSLDDSITIRKESGRLDKFTNAPLLDVARLSGAIVNPRQFDRGALHVKATHQRASAGQR